MDQPLRLGMIGAGTIAQRLHLPALREIGGVDVVALAEPNPARLHECADNFGIERGHTDYREMLDRGDLDAVVIATPNAFHAPAALAALEAGCHVLVEKPMATSGADARRMAEVARERGKVLTLNLPRRFAAPYLAARALLDAGQLGEVYAASATLIRRAGIPGYGSWFTTAALSGGGALLDAGIHILDTILWVLGEPAVLAVSATASNHLGRAGRGLGTWGVDRGTAGTFDVEDGLTALLRLAGGISLTLDVAWAAYAPAQIGIRLLGTRGGAVADERGFMEGTTELHTDGPDGPVVIQAEQPTPPVSPSYAPISGFLDSIRTGAPPPVSPDTGAYLAEICDALYASARAGREVRLDSRENFARPD
jgi:predicted dehydrogenase